MPEPLNIAFVDQDDKKFYEVAKFCDAWLITGNKRHFPVEPKIVSATEFLELDNKKWYVNAKERGEKRGVKIGIERNKKTRTTGSFSLNEKKAYK